MRTISNKTVFENNELTDFAAQIYENQKDDFIDAISCKIKKGINQFENGEYMNFDEFKTKFIKEHSLYGKI
jgi:hypothetical protein